MLTIQEPEEPYASLSRTQDRFLAYAAANPSCLDPASFAALGEFDAQVRYPVQPWPAFLGPERRREMERATVGLARLIEGLPARVFANDPLRIAEYFGETPERMTLLAPALARADGLAGAIGRADLIDGPEGFQCCELNLAGNIGGWELGSWGSRFLSLPVIARFLEREGIAVRVSEPLAPLFDHLIARALSRPVGEVAGRAGSCNVAITFEEPPPEGWTTYTEELFRVTLSEHAARAGRSEPVSGQLIVCSQGDLRRVDGHLCAGDRPLRAVVDTEGGAALPPLVAALLADSVDLYNGPLTPLLINKLNIALLSELQESELFSVEERAIIRRHVPWTRRVTDDFADYGDERVYLPDFLHSQQHRLVVKQARSMQGSDVYVGRFLSQESWAERVRQALAEKLWVVQEFVPSVPYPFLAGEGGCVPHDVVWGAFVFGDRFGGSFVRAVPRGSSATGVINLSQRAGACQGIVLDVDD